MECLVTASCAFLAQYQSAQCAQAASYQQALNDLKAKPQFSIGNSTNSLRRGRLHNQKSAIRIAYDKQGATCKQRLDAEEVAYE